MTEPRSSERGNRKFRDSLIRTSGFFPGTLTDQANLFTVAGKGQGESNLQNGSTLPSDQSMVVLALRVFTWFRASIQRSQVAAFTIASGPPLQWNGDYAIANPAAGAAAAALLNGSVPGDSRDTYRLHWQAEEQLLWTFGAGEKNSLKSMPTAYFPYGGGLHGDMGGSTDLIHWNNGMPDHAGILRLARAILLPPRQNIICTAQIVALPDGGNGPVFGATQGARNMLSLTANLNAVDLVGKCISFTFDGQPANDNASLSFAA